jgi:hypothetical protein
MGKLLPGTSQRARPKPVTDDTGLPWRTAEVSRFFSHRWTVLAVARVLLITVRPPTDPLHLQSVWAGSRRSG